MASQDVSEVSTKRLTYDGWLDSNEDRKSYANHVNPVWVKLLDTLGMNVNYTHASGSELRTSDGRTILDCLSGYCVHNVGHNHPFVVAELVAELQRQSPGMLQSNVVKEAGKLARILCENAGGKVSKVFFCSSGRRISRVRACAALSAEKTFSQRVAFRCHYAISPWSDYVEVHWGV